MGMADGFVQKLIDKYGGTVINLKMGTLDQLEKIAKDVQREANRRYDIAYRRKEMQDTEAFKKFSASGGKISLSRNAERVNGHLKLVQNQTAAQYRNYLMGEISRGLDYLRLKKSTYTGYKDWKLNVVEGAKRAYRAAGGTDPKFERVFEDTSFSSYFWKCVRRFEDKYTSVYYSLGSGPVINYTHTLLSSETGLTVDEAISIVYEASVKGLTASEVIDLLSERRKT